MRFLDFPGPAEGPVSRNRSGHVLSAPSLWSQCIARTSRWSRQYASTSIPKSCRLQCTSPADSPRKSIWDPIGHIHPPPFRFLELQRGSRETEWSTVRVHIDSRVPPVRLQPISMCQVNSEGKGRRKAIVHLKGGEQFVYQRSHLISLSTHFKWNRMLPAFYCTVT